MKRILLALVLVLCTGAMAFALTPTVVPHCSSHQCAFSTGTITLTSNHTAGQCIGYTVAGLQEGDLFVLYPPLSSGAAGIAWYVRISQNNTIQICSGAMTVNNEVWTYVWWDRT